MTSTTITRNSPKTIRSMYVLLLSHSLMALSAFHALRELSFLKFRKVVERVRLALSSTKQLIIAKRNRFTRTYKILTGRARRLIPIFKKKLKKRQKIHCTKNVLSKNHSQQENSAFNATTMNILTMISHNVPNVATANTSTKISTAVHSPKATSKQIQKNLQILFSKADQRMSGCTSTTKTLNRTME